jgi:hypothetical protein
MEKGMGQGTVCRPELPYMSRLIATIRHMSSGTMFFKNPLPPKVIFAHYSA